RDETFDGVFGAETSAAQRRSKSATAPLFPSRVRPCSRGEGPGVDLGAFLWSFSEDEVGGCLADLGAHRSEFDRLVVGPGCRNVRTMVLYQLLNELTDIGVTVELLAVGIPVAYDEFIPTHQLILGLLAAIADFE